MPVRLLALGIRAVNAAPVGSMVTVLFTKGVPGVPLEGQSGNAAGEKVDPVEYAGQTSLKLPVRSASEGTCWLTFSPGTISLRHSCDQKKKVFCLAGW